MFSKNTNVPIFFSLCLFISFLVIFCRLFNLQIIESGKLALAADQNRIKIMPQVAPRGIIYDRQNQVLAHNTTTGREYPLGEAAAHVVGYVGEATSDELETFTVSLGSTLGKLGIEREEDKLLRGADGGIVVETGANGEVIRELSKNEATAGRDLHLFLDGNLQKIAYEILDKKKGVIVASRPNGEVLAMVSSPSFDPNVFTLSDTRSQTLDSILHDPDQPLFNRAIAGQYPPGSVFKIVTATAGLETQAMRPDEEIEDTGEIRVGQFRYGNWYFYQYGKKEGMVNLVKALQRSNDIYFYKVGERLGITKLASWAKVFGFGQPTGIPLNGEADGLVPDSQWKEKIKNEPWYLGDTYITAIGQGNLETTPIQINQMTATVANSGQKCRPRLVDDGLKPICQELPVKAENLAVVKEGMRMACAEGGTGWPFFNFRIENKESRIKIDNVDFFQDASSSGDMVRIPVACKTGTAEYTNTNNQTHAWFTAYAPVNQPQIVVTVLLEGAGQGSDQAGPLAKKILETWFEE